MQKLVIWLLVKNCLYLSYVNNACLSTLLHICWNKSTFSPFCWCVRKGFLNKTLYSTFHVLS